MIHAVVVPGGDAVDLFVQLENGESVRHVVEKVRGHLQVVLDNYDMVCLGVEIVHRVFQGPPVVLTYSS